MRTVIQRVQHASVTIDGEIKSKIGNGFLLLLGVEESDTTEDVDWLVKEVAALRVFDDENGVMIRSIIDVGGEARGEPVYTLRFVQEGQPPVVVSCRTSRDFGAALRGILPQTVGCARP